MKQFLRRNLNVIGMSLDALSIVVLICGLIIYGGKASRVERRLEVLENRVAKVEQSDTLTTVQADTIK